MNNITEKKVIYKKGTAPPVSQSNICDANVQEYLDSLDSNVTSITLIGHGLSKVPSLARFTKLKKFNCRDNLLTELPELGDEIEEIYCTSNRLKELNIVKYPKLREVYCGCNKISRIDGYPDSLYHINAQDNMLVDVPEFNKLRMVNYSCNYLTTVPKFTADLWSLECCDNKITHFPRFHYDAPLKLSCINNPLRKLPVIRNQNAEIYAMETMLMELPIPEDLDTLPITETPTSYSIGSPDLCIHINDTPISEIMGMTSIYCGMDDTYEQASALWRIISKFRFTYYAQKFRKNFMKFLWEKIRLPKIQHKYRPERLLEILDQMQDSDDENELFDTIENENNW